MTIRCPKCYFDNPDDTIYCGKCAELLKSPEEIAITKTLITHAERLQKGSTIAGRYRIIEELGRGGMGVVYKAEDTKLKRTVALKFLPLELTHISEVKERFMREAQAAAALDHPNICTVHEFDEAEEKTFISMAYIEGQSLKNKIEFGPLELDEALRIATQVAEGLQEAHKKGVVHRDIKSANIMVTEKGQAKIMDFGLARVAGGTLVTKEGTTMGTIAYMSPEQARGEEVDHRTDIWSLGVVLYEMFSGHLPFKGEQDQAVVYSILKEKPKPITDLKAEIPMAIEQVVSRALEKNLDKRYQHMEELLDDLRDISEGIVPERVKARLRKAKLLKRKRAILYASIAGFFILMTVIALSLFTGRAERAIKLAVLPFINLTGDPEQEYLSDGITEEMIAQLGRLHPKSLGVIGRRSVMRYKKSETPIDQIGRELGVDYVLEGSAQREGNRVRITAELVHVSDQTQLWADTYEREFSGILTLRSEVVQKVAGALALKLLPDEQIRLASVRTVDPEAHEAYLKGKFHLSKMTPDGYEKGLTYLNEAIEKDPTNPLAHAALALGYSLIGHERYPDAFARAKEAARKAEELGGDPPAEMYLAFGMAKLYSDWDYLGAAKDLRRAVEIDPSLGEARRDYSWYLLLIGQRDEALKEMKRAQEAEPLVPLFYADRGWQYWWAGQNEEAIEEAQKALELNPDFSFGLHVLGSAYAEKKMYAEAIAAHQKLATVDPDMRWSLIRTYVQAGRQDEARKTLAKYLAEEPAPTGAWAGWFLAEAYAALGDKEEAFRWLEAAYKERHSFLPWLRDNPPYAPLHSDPRFQDLVRRMKLSELK